MFYLEYVACVVVTIWVGGVEERGKGKGEWKGWIDRSFLLVEPVAENTSG